MDVVWFKNNTAISESTDNRISYEKNKHSLEILRLKQTDCKLSFEDRMPSLDILKAKDTGSTEYSCVVMVQGKCTFVLSVLFLFDYICCVKCNATTYIVSQHNTFVSTSRAGNIF